MSKYNCIIIEDERPAAALLEDYISKVPFLTLKGICSDTIRARELMKKNQIDLIFLDIHLPGQNGMDFLRSQEHYPKVIITSANAEYALECYRYGILDYLKKPIEFNRFMVAVNRLGARKTDITTEIPSNDENCVTFRVGKKMVRLNLNEILYIESLKEHTRILTAKDCIITRVSLSEMEKMLENDNFLRIHRSFIISLDAVTAYSSTEVELGTTVIPLGRFYKSGLYKALTKQESANNSAI